MSGVIKVYIFLNSDFWFWVGDRNVDEIYFIFILRTAVRRHGLQLVSPPHVSGSQFPHR